MGFRVQGLACLGCSLFSKFIYPKVGYLKTLGLAAFRDFASCVGRYGASAVNVMYPNVGNVYSL